MNAADERSSAFTAPVIPARRPDISCVELDGEAVLYDAATGRMHALNPAAYLLWQCFEEPVPVDVLVAELVDELGAEPASVEADVRAMVATSIAEGLLVLADTEPGADDEDRSTSRQSRRRSLVEPSTDCPGCVRRLDRLGWAATRAIEVGEHIVGVRSSTAEVDDVIRRVLEAHLVDGIEAPPAFSIDVRPVGDAGRRRLQLLYRSTTAVTRSRSVSRVVRSLLAHLGALADETIPGSPRLSAMAFVAGRQAVLAPGSMRVHLAMVEPRLNQAGVRVVDAPVIVAGSGPSSITVPAPSLALAPTTSELLRGLDGTGSLGRELPAAEPGDYEVVGWITSRREGTGGGMTEPGLPTAVRNFLGSAAPRVSTDPATVVQRLHALGTTPGVPVARTASAIVEAVLALHR